jgi:hypothetical protein
MKKFTASLGHFRVVQKLLRRRAADLKDIYVMIQGVKERRRVLKLCAVSVLRRKKLDTVGTHFALFSPPSKAVATLRGSLRRRAFSLRTRLGECVNYQAGDFGPLRDIIKSLSTPPPESRSDDHRDGNGKKKLNPFSHSIDASCTLRNNHTQTHHDGGDWRVGKEAQGRQRRRWC